MRAHLLSSRFALCIVMFQGLSAVARPPSLLSLLSGNRLGDGFGANIHFTNATPAQFDQLAGPFRVARMDVTWANVERSPACGQYTWTNYDTLINALSARGVRLHGILDYGNSACYAGCGTALSNASACIGGFTNFTLAALARYAGRGVVWEFYNEPNIVGVPLATYVGFFGAVLNATRTAFPNETLAGPALGGLDRAWVAGLLAGGLLEYWDAFSWHPYRQGAPETVLAHHAELQAGMHAYQPASRAAAGLPDVPVVSGEWGYTSVPCYADGRGCPCSGADCDAVQLATQGKYLARMFLANALCGVPLSIWYDFRDDGPRGSPNSQENFGTLFYSDWSPKPAYTAAATLQAVVGGAWGVSAVLRLNTSAHSVAPLPASATPKPPSAWDTFALALPGPPRAVGGGSIELTGPVLAVWSNVSTSTLAVADRVECGACNITLTECLARGCAFDETAGNATTQCYYPGPYMQATVALPPGLFPGSNSSDPGAGGAGLPPPYYVSPTAYLAPVCFAVIDYLGYRRPDVCALNPSALTVPLYDAPQYYMLLR